MGCCSAPNCKNSSEAGFRQYRFPLHEPERLKKWLINCRRDRWKPNSNSRLCEVHFEESQFEQHRQDQWEKLKPNAIPIIFHVSNPLQSIEKLHQKSMMSGAQTTNTKKKYDEYHESEILLPSASQRGRTGHRQSRSMKTLSEKIAVRGLMRHYWKKGLNPTATAITICQVEGNVTNRRTVSNWFKCFANGDTNLDDKPRSGQPTIMGKKVQQPQANNQ